MGIAAPLAAPVAASLVGSAAAAATAATVAITAPVGFAYGGYQLYKYLKEKNEQQET